MFEIEARIAQVSIVIEVVAVEILAIVVMVFNCLLRVLLSFLSMFIRTTFYLSSFLFASIIFSPGKILYFCILHELSVQDFGTLDKGTSRFLFSIASLFFHGFIG